MRLSTLIVIASLAIGLVCFIDLWNKKCSVLKRVLWSPVPFVPLLGPMLYYALFEPPAVRNEVPVPKDSIEQWKEWLGNRYNPGHFTGGQIHPISRAVGPAAGILFIATGIISLGMVVFMASDGMSDGSAGVLAMEIGIGLVLIVAGLTKIAVGRKKKGKEERKASGRIGQ